MPMEIDQNSTLSMGRKTVSWVMAGLILSGALIFGVGYFMGYRHALVSVQNQIKQTNLQDQAAQVLAEDAAQDLNTAAVVEDPEKWNGDLEMEQVLPTSQTAAQAVNVPSEVVVADSKSAQLESSAQTDDEQESTQGSYYAELVGFGYQKAAQDFVAKAKRKGYPVILVEKTNRTGKGRVVTWYQAVTENFSSKAELERLIRTIKRTEHLQGIKIKSV
jgi:cell division septation protein DedD